MKRSVFLISDRTGITAEVLWRSLRTQFPDFEFVYRRFPFVDTERQMQDIASEVLRAGEREGEPSVLTAHRSWRVARNAGHVR